MDDSVFHHIPTLFIVLISLILLSIFFSLAETAMLSVNRYRLRHLVKQNHRTAKRVQQLLERPDRMLGVILLCDTFADILASALATVIAVHYFGNQGVMIAAIVMTTLVLIFGEMAPKTLAALYPQRIAFLSAWPLIIILRIFYPFIWLANTIANGLLSLFGVKVQKATIEHFTHEEFATILREAGGRIPSDFQSMLLKILDLEKITVNDIMVPRSEIVGIDLTEDWEQIIAQLTQNTYNRLPVYRENIDNIVGILQARKVLRLLSSHQFNREHLLELVEEAYFVPEEISIHTLLFNLRSKKKRLSLVVSEYGDILGMVVLEDILEEIVGEFTTDIGDVESSYISPHINGSYWVAGNISIRELNQKLSCHLPTDTAKTLSGLIIDHLETIPSGPVIMKIADLSLEVVQLEGNVIKKVKILPLK